jgi:hypothetical protein
MRAQPISWQHRPLMHGDVISLVALDLELRVIFTGMARIAFVLRIARVDLDYPTGNIASLGIPEKRDRRL